MKIERLIGILSLLTLIENRSEKEKNTCYDFSAEAASVVILSAPRAATTTGR